MYLTSGLSRLNAGLLFLRIVRFFSSKVRFIISLLGFYLCLFHKCKKVFFVYFGVWWGVERMKERFKY